MTSVMIVPLNAPSRNIKLPARFDRPSQMFVCHLDRTMQSRAFCGTRVVCVRRSGNASTCTTHLRKPASAGCGYVSVSLNHDSVMIDQRLTDVCNECLSGKPEQFR